jgi:hypothetical protein
MKPIIHLAENIVEQNKVISGKAAELYQTANLKRKTWVIEIQGNAEIIWIRAKYLFP